MRAIWFPLVYLAFTLPPPDTVVAAVTQPIKIAHLGRGPYHCSTCRLSGRKLGRHDPDRPVSAARCRRLRGPEFDRDAGRACLFYVYLRHRSNFAAFVVVALAAIPVAMFSNFVRVLVLVLVTYYFGEAAAQGFVHDFAGLLMFAVALLTIFAIDQLATPLYSRARRASRSMKPAFDSFAEPADRPAQVPARAAVLLGGGGCRLAAADARSRLSWQAKLEDIVPKTIGRWKFVAASGLVVPPEDQLPTRSTASC